MSENSTLHDHPEITPASPLSPPRDSEDESPPVSQDRHASTPGSPVEPEKEIGDTATTETEKVGRFRREVEHLNGLFDEGRVGMVMLEREGGKLIQKCRRREDQIVELKRKITEMHVSYWEAEETQARKTRAMQTQLKQTEELLEARSAELSAAQAFLSTADHLSEMEVLSIVRDLNENIYQVAVGLVEEWEKLDPSQTTTRMDVDPTSRPDVPTLVRLTRGRDATGLTFLLQTWLCFLAADMTSNWGRHQESATLRSIYKRLAASGEHHIFDPGNIQLTYCRGASDLSQVEVFDLQSPLPTTPRFRIIGEAIGEGR